MCLFCRTNAARCNGTLILFRETAGGQEPPYVLSRETRSDLGSDSWPESDSPPGSHSSRVARELASQLVGSSDFEWDGCHSGLFSMPHENATRVIRGAMGRKEKLMD